MIENVTNLGDAALLLPASLLLFGYFLARRDLGRAMAFALAFTTCMVLTILAKLFFITAAFDGALFEIRSPSGHTSFCTTYFGCLALAAAEGRSARLRGAIYAVAGVLIIAIGLSRVAVQAHDIQEVVLGLGIGLLCVGVFNRTRPALNVATANLMPVALSTAILAVMLNGLHLSAEQVLFEIALRLHSGS